MLICAQLSCNNALRDACPLRPDIASKGIDIMVVMGANRGHVFWRPRSTSVSMGQEAWDTECYSVEEVEGLLELYLKLL